MHVQVEADRGHDLGNIVLASSSLERLQLEIKKVGHSASEKKLSSPLKRVIGLANETELNLLARKVC